MLRPPDFDGGWLWRRAWRGEGAKGVWALAERLSAEPMGAKP